MSEIGKNRVLNGEEKKELRRLRIKLEKAQKWAKSAKTKREEMLATLETISVLKEVEAFYASIGRNIVEETKHVVSS